MRRNLLPKLSGKSTAERFTPELVCFQGHHQREQPLHQQPKEFTLLALPSQFCRLLTALEPVPFLLVAKGEAFLTLSCGQDPLTPTLPRPLLFPSPSSLSGERGRSLWPSLMLIFLKLPSLLRSLQPRLVPTTTLFTVLSLLLWHCVACSTLTMNEYQESLGGTGVSFSFLQYINK